MVARSGSLEGEISTFNRRIELGPGGSSSKVGFPRCRVSVADWAEPGMRSGGDANAGGSVTTLLSVLDRKSVV